MGISKCMECGDHWETSTPQAICPICFRFQLEQSPEFRAKIKRGLEDIDANRVVSLEELKRRYLNQ